MTDHLPFNREDYGRFVREEWVRWAQEQPEPKPSWLVPYDELSEADKEADRRIGECIAKWTMIGCSARYALGYAVAFHPSPENGQILRTIYLYPAQDRELRRRAFTRGCSRAELIRQFVEEGLAKAEPSIAEEIEGRAARG